MSAIHAQIGAHMKAEYRRGLAAVLRGGAALGAALLFAAAWGGRGRWTQALRRTGPIS
jgi:hypothetical protein